MLDANFLNWPTVDSKYAPYICKVRVATLMISEGGKRMVALEGNPNSIQFTGVEIKTFLSQFEADVWEVKGNWLDRNVDRTESSHFLVADRISTISNSQRIFHRWGRTGYMATVSAQLGGYWVKITPISVTYYIDNGRWLLSAKEVSQEAFDKSLKRSSNFICTAGAVAVVTLAVVLTLPRI